MRQEAWAQRDITYGGDARAFAMGGAGIALLNDSMNTGGTRTNPATLAYETQPIGVNFPSFALRGRGPISLGSASGYLLRGTSLSNAASLARDFASDDSDFAINANTSLRVGHIEISGFAVARGRIQPNASLRSWVDAGRPAQNFPLDARSDIFAAGYYTLPTIASALVLPNPQKRPYNYAVGGRLKYMTGVYTHYIANAQTFLTGDDALPAGEMGGKKTLLKRGIGADLGLLARRRDGHGITGGLVIANAVRPSFTFDGTDRNGNNKRYDILQTTLSVGAGYSEHGTTFAADLVDITSAVDKGQLRLGAEQRFGGKIALRGGYNTANGFTYGIGFFGFDVAFGRRQSLEVVRTLNF